MVGEPKGYEVEVTILEESHPANKQKIEDRRDPDRLRLGNRWEYGAESGESKVVTQAT